MVFAENKRELGNEKIFINNEGLPLDDIQGPKGQMKRQRSVKMF